MNRINQTTGLWIIGTLFIAVIAIFVLLDPIPQDIEYHNFSDQVGLGILPNALNVLSNIPFILVGIIGLLAMGKNVKQPLQLLASNRFSYSCLFTGTALVGLGSVYYHLTPNNDTLVWDRIPMTIAFMALYSIIIGEYVSERLGRLCLVPFILIGVFSVVFWWFTESSGAGDLRLYAVIQFFPIITIPIILVLFRSEYDQANGYWMLIATYIAAKVFETFDYQIHGTLSIISGHSIKHLLPAIGLYYLIMSYRKRLLINQH